MYNLVPGNVPLPNKVAIFDLPHPTQQVSEKFCTLLTIAHKMSKYNSHTSLLNYECREKKR